MKAAKIVNVATHLADMAVAEPHRLAVAFPHSRDRAGRVAYNQLTFLQLHQDSDSLAHGLESIGIRRGMRTVLMTPPSLEFFSLTFALFKIGAVPVLIDPGMGIRNLGRCLAEAEPAAFIGVPKSHLARKLLGWGRSTIRLTVTTGKRFGQFRLDDLRERGRRESAFPMAATTGDETAAILFTSGSTGIAKGVDCTHGIFAAQIELLRRAYRIEPGEVDLSTFPLFALFGPALGMTAIIPEMNPTRPAQVEPTKIIEAIESFGVTNLFGSPALLDRVGRYGAAHGMHLPTLKRVISAGAPVGAKVIERFASLLEPSSEVHTPYGATEALPLTSISSGELLQRTRAATERGCGVCVGRPIEPVHVRIIPISDEPIREWVDSDCLELGRIGEIAVSGPIVTSAYFNRPQATELAKILDPSNGQVWHRMGDLGYLDAAGRLWFCGRIAHRVTTVRGTMFTIPCEAVFNVHPDLFRSALVGVGSGPDVFPVLCVEREPTRTQRPWREIERELQEIARQHPHTRAIQTFLVHAAFPVDIRHNAKIFREKLARWAASRLRGQKLPELPESIPQPPVFDEKLEPVEGAKS